MRIQRHEEPRLSFIEPLAETEGFDKSELFLDNMVYVRMTKPCGQLELLSILGLYYTGGHKVNPFIALAEQMLSNPQSHQAVDDFVANDSLGIVPMGYSQIVRDIPNSAKHDMCKHIARLYPYVALLAHLLRTRRKDALDSWLAAFVGERPRFHCLYLLGDLLLSANIDRNLRSKETGDRLQRHAQSFGALRSAEVDDYARFLRNRAFDIALWYVTPIVVRDLELLADGRRPVVVTGDRFVSDVLFRYFPWAVNANDKRLVFGLALDQLEGWNGIEERVSRLPKTDASPPSNDKHASRFADLIQYVKANVPTDEFAHTWDAMGRLLSLSDGMNDRQLSVAELAAQLV